MKKINLEKVIEIIEWAKEQGHIRGEVDLLIRNIYKYAEED